MLGLHEVLSDVNVDGKEDRLLDDKGFLFSLQIADSFFPTGMVALSHALETFADEEGIESEAEIDRLLGDYLCHQIAVADSVALANAHRAAEEADLPSIMMADRTLTAMKLAEESRDGSVKSGRRVLVACRQLTSAAVIDQLTDAVELGQSPGNYAIVMGVLSSALGIPRRQAMLVELYSFSVSFLAAAVRLGRLNYLEVQRILSRTGVTISRLVDENIDKTCDEMRAFTPAIDIMGMKHQRAHKRLFIS